MALGKAWADEFMASRERIKQFDEANTIKVNRLNSESITVRTLRLLRIWGSNASPEERRRPKRASTPQNCKNLLFALAAPETLKTRTGVAEWGGVWGRGGGISLILYQRFSHVSLDSTQTVSPRHDGWMPRCNQICHATLRSACALLPIVVKTDSGLAAPATSDSLHPHVSPCPLVPASPASPD